MGVKSVPSRVIYSIDVPEVTELQTRFVYNYFIPDESVKDKDVLSEESVKKMNVSQDIISKSRSEIAEKYIDYINARIPRYVKIDFKRPKNIKISNSLAPNLISSNIDKIVSEEQFSTKYYTAINFNNGSVDKKINDLFSESAALLRDETSAKVGTSLSTYSNVKKYTGRSNLDVVSNSLNQKELSKGIIYRQGDSKKIVNDYFGKLKYTNTYSQISNNVLLDLSLQSQVESNSLASKVFKNISFARSLSRSNNNFDIHDNEFKTSIPHYKIISSADHASVPSEFSLVGYFIEKIELFQDGTQLVKDPIIVEDPNANCYVDFDVRYGTVYVYRVKTVVEVVYPAVDNRTGNLSMISSLITSKAIISSVETTENIGPPAPVELRFVWDYDRINPLTTQFDPTSNRPIPYTGIKGSLFVYWSFPINSQMDIKKFQIFRRKSISDPFELIRMFDFDDSISKFPYVETEINPKLIQENSQNPESSYYDDDFQKNSEYIYAVAAIDSHGLTSNYSEQFSVKFDSFTNKLNLKLISIANAPKQYPNLYINNDLFVDSIKTTNKKTLNVYFTPQCYKISKKGKDTVEILRTSNSLSSYKINFINIENQSSTQLNINVNDLRAKKPILNFKPGGSKK